LPGQIHQSSGAYSEELDTHWRIPDAAARVNSPGLPVDWGELSQSHGAGEFGRASPDDLPMIDIHCL
jgi:hypothetical protein